MISPTAKESFSEPSIVPGDELHPVEMRKFKLESLETSK